MKQALADRADRPDDLVAAGRQADMIFLPGQRALGLRASKLWHLLVKLVGVDLAAEGMHTIPLADLYEEGIGHMTHKERVKALRELQTTLVEITVPSPKIKGKPRKISGALLAHVERDEDDRGDLVIEFSRTMRSVFADSPHWAVLSKRAVMACESRYSLRLFEIVALRANLDHVTWEKFELDDLRARLGVPEGKLTTWSNLRVSALDPAIAEVNQLAGFTVRYEPIKHGRTVVAIKLHWAKKPVQALKATKKELDSPKLGRKARRDGATETVAVAAPVIEFPLGSIKYTAFEAIARENLPAPRRDVDLVAGQFRQAAKRDGKPLRGDHVPKMFAAFCSKQKPADE